MKLFPAKGKRTQMYILLAVLISVMFWASLAKAETLGIIETSGLVFKDTLEVKAFDDPDIKNITCFVTVPKRALSFEDQTNSSISCRKTGSVVGVGISSKKRVFKESKGLFFKSMYVDRIFDKKRNSILYVSYTKKMTGDNASSSISVVVLDSN